MHPIIQMGLPEDQSMVVLILPLEMAGIASPMHSCLAVRWRLSFVPTGFPATLALKVDQVVEHDCLVLSPTICRYYKVLDVLKGRNSSEMQKGHVGMFETQALSIPGIRATTNIHQSDQEGSSTIAVNFNPALNTFQPSVAQEALVLVVDVMTAFCQNLPRASSLDTFLHYWM